MYAENRNNISKKQQNLGENRGCRFANLGRVRTDKINNDDLRFRTSSSQKPANLKNIPKAKLNQSVQSEKGMRKGSDLNVTKKVETSEHPILKGIKAKQTGRVTPIKQHDDKTTKPSLEKIKDHILIQQLGAVLTKINGILSKTMHYSDFKTVNEVKTSIIKLIEIRKNSCKSRTIAEIKKVESPKKIIQLQTAPQESVKATSIEHDQNKVEVKVSNLDKEEEKEEMIFHPTKDFIRVPGPECIYDNKKKAKKERERLMSNSALINAPGVPIIIDRYWTKEEQEEIFRKRREEEEKNSSIPMFIEKKESKCEITDGGKNTIEQKVEVEKKSNATSIALIEQVKCFNPSCQRKGEKFDRCTRCKINRYCSVDCQKAHWSVHVKECKAAESNASIQTVSTPTIVVPEKKMIPRLHDCDWIRGKKDIREECEKLTSYAKKRCLMCNAMMTAKQMVLNDPSCLKN